MGQRMNVYTSAARKRERKYEQGAPADLFVAERGVAHGLFGELGGAAQPVPHERDRLAVNHSHCMPPQHISKHIRVRLYAARVMCVCVRACVYPCGTVFARARVYMYMCVRACGVCFAHTNQLLYRATRTIFEIAPLCKSLDDFLLHVDALDAPQPANVQCAILA